MSIEIDRGIPVAPTPGRAEYNSKYPTKDLDVGDSFAVPIPYDKDAKTFSRTVASAVYSFARRRNLDWSFAVRILDEGGRDVVRIWRTK